MAITTSDVRARMARNLSQVNSLWVRLKHRETYKLRSRRNWVDRWRADKLGDSKVRARRLYLPTGRRRTP